MATAPLEQQAGGSSPTAVDGAAPHSGAAALPPNGGVSRRRKTSHLKDVPEPRSLRETLRGRCADAAGRLDKSHPLSKDDLERIARELLALENQPEGLVGWTMVALATEFWRDQVAAVPFARRLLLLPHCLKHAEGCPADYDEFGLDCRRCGACSIADFRTAAEDLGYKVLVAEGSPIVLKIIVGGYIDAIVGVACLNVLEKAIDKILLAGIPCMAVPLLSSDCRNTSVDEDWVEAMIRLEHRPSAAQTRSYVHLMRSAAGLFVPDELERLAPRQRGAARLTQSDVGLDALDPIACTEAIAYDFLAKGGKYARPLITLASYDARLGAPATGPDGAEHCAAVPDAVRRAALAIEVFHKASLVHDDIEDDDPFRYGAETLHRQFGTPLAINVGDYLIGLGYRLVSRDAAALGSDVVADILSILAEAHLRLSEGQGAELVWRDGRDKRLTPLDALKIYSLKTAPAFEAAMLSGLRLAGDIAAYREPVAQFARHLGVAFQILNDLDDWTENGQNKRATALDVLGGRPTVLWALALEALSADDRAELQRLVANGADEAATPRLVERLYQKAGAFETAQRLVEKYRQRAEEVADSVEPDELRRLWYYLSDTILGREAAPEPNEPAVVSLNLVGNLAR